MGELYLVLFVMLCESPNEQLSILADRGQSGSLRVELAEPNLLLVLPKGQDTASRQERLWALMVLQQRVILFINVVVGTRIDLPPY